VYLKPAERRAATVLHRSLEAVRARYGDGERSAAALCQTVLDCLASEPLARTDYAAVVDPDSLLPLSAVEGRALVAVAAFVGGTRLIDNILLGQGEMQ
jgi:pantothenate synthetase